MDKAKIKTLVEAEIAKAMEAAHVTSPRVIGSYLWSRAESTVDHAKDTIIVEARTDSGACLPLSEYLDKLRSDPEFSQCFELALRPRPVERPYEIRYGRDEQRPGDLEAIASGKAVLTGWRPTPEITELADDEIAASDSAAINRSVEKIASGEIKVRLDV